MVADTCKDVASRCPSPVDPMHTIGPRPIHTLIATRLLVQYALPGARIGGVLLHSAEVCSQLQTYNKCVRLHARNTPRPNLHNFIYVHPASTSERHRALCRELCRRYACKPVGLRRRPRWARRLVEHRSDVLAFVAARRPQSQCLLWPLQTQHNMHTLHAARWRCLSAADSSGAALPLQLCAT